MDREFDLDLLKKIELEGIDADFLEHLLSSLFNTFPDHIYLKDRQSRFILINESMKDLFQIQKTSEAIGKTDFEFFSEEHAQRAFDDEQEIMESGKGRENFVEKETWEDGTVSWVASTKVPLLDKNKKIIGLFGISRDITARKNAEIEMNNRAMELDCFIEISKIAKSRDVTAEGHMRKVATLMPKYLGHAGISAVRIIIGNKAIKKSGFKETPFMKKYRIRDNGKRIGTIEIFTDYKVEKFGPTTDQVIKLICDRISEILEKKWIEKDLRKWEHILKDAERHMDLYP